MNKDEVKNQLESIVKELGVNKKYIEADSNLFSGGIFDSMVSIDYMLKIEEVFGVPMSMPIIEETKLGKISSMIEYIFEKTKSMEK